MMKRVIDELRTWNWPAMACLIFMWCVVFYEVLR